MTDHRLDQAVRDLVFEELRNALREGAEVIRRRRGWTHEELAAHIDLEPAANAKHSSLPNWVLGERIKELRELNDLTPAELAARAKVEENLILAVEAKDLDAINNLGIEQLTRISSALSTNAAFLVYWANTP
jgi:ribosome-binding protein aMBF1 (putative translation factor)